MTFPGTFQKYLTALLLCLPMSGIWAQTEMSAFTATGRGGVATTFVTDYHAIGINPANLGKRKSFRDPRLTFGFMEMQATFTTEALNRRELANAIFRTGRTSFSFDEKAAAAEKLANTNLSLNVDLMLAGAAISLPGGHGLAFSIRDRQQLFARVNSNAAEILFLGANAGYFPDLLLSNGRVVPNPRFPGNQGVPPLTEVQRETLVQGLFSDSTQARFYADILDGTRVSASWFREYNLSYGKKIVETYDFALYAGAGVKILNGMMLVDLAASGGQLTQSNISVSPTFGLDFGDDTQVTNPTFRGTENASLFRQFVFPRPVGTGLGFDLGMTMVVKRHLTLGMAITNIGQLQWDGNVYQVNNGRLVQFEGTGLNNYNILATSEGAFQFAGELSPLRWEGSNQISTALPSIIRGGVSYEFFKTLHVGFDVMVPRNKIAGNLESTLWAIGADLHAYKMFRLSAGINAGGNNGARVNLPVGITYIARRGFYEAGVATRDLMTYLANIGQGSTLSFATGFLRFKIL